MNAPIIPPLTTEDMLPDDRAVWRDPPQPLGCSGHQAITVEYSGGAKEKTFVDRAIWTHVRRWRFGWAAAA